MTAKLTLFVVCCSSAFPQISASALRAKYGEPLPQESFHVLRTVALVIYGPRHEACRIELPPGSYVNRPGFATTREVDEAVDELVPRRVRGKEIKKIASDANRISDYENVTIAEPQDPDHPGQRTAVWITFKRPDCSLGIP